MYFKHLLNNEWKSDNNNSNEMKNSLKISFIGIYIGNKWMHWICRYSFRNIYDCYYIIWKQICFCFYSNQNRRQNETKFKKGNNNLFSRLKNWEILVFGDATCFYYFVGQLFFSLFDRFFFLTNKLNEARFFSLCNIFGCVRQMKCRFNSFFFVFCY